MSQGGSTLTQQLAKNLFLTQERTLSRKVQEVALALWLERKFSKTQILDLYLNRVYFGAGAYGIEAAAQRYFSKPATKLTVAEAATLAGLVRSPSRLAPSRNPDGAEKRAQVVLAAMMDMKFITDDMAKVALIQPAHAIKPPGAGSVGYVADWVMDVLDDLIGRVEQDIVVETSVDPALQTAAETALVDELAKNGAKAGVGQGAVVALSPDGAVRALVGGQELRREPVQPRGGGEAPARLGVQAVRLSHRDRARADARHGARGQADRGQGLAAGELQPRVFRPGVADQGAGAVAQHRVGAADAGVRADRRDAHRAPARHRLQARAQRFARARHLRGLGARAGRRLRRLRQRRQRRVAACGRAGALGERQALVPAQRTTVSAASSRRATPA